MLRLFTSLSIAAFSLSAPAMACQVALVLAMDVSNSIDPGEYQLQTDGLAAALRDPVVAQELVQGQVALSVVQWSGRGEQVVSLPWRQMMGPGDVAAFARAAETMPRAYIGSNTAVGDIITFALSYLRARPDCLNQVVDISGDGQDNAGTDPRQARSIAERAGVQINGLAIDGGGAAITNYFLGHVRTRDGFVMSARGYRDYPRALRAKMLREIARSLF